MRPNIETHYKDITSHFQKADNNLHQSTRISTPIYTNLHQDNFNANQCKSMYIDVNFNINQ